MKKRKEQTVGEALQALVKGMNWTQKINQARLENIWRDEMGDFITRQTRSIVLKNKILYIEIESAALRMELSYGRDLLTKRLNESLAEEYLTDVVLK
ncbi:MAG: hypothetical protein RL757_3360 [Bacteroidota bacterium]|jgi:predicted nucleic acid-binding Zn ribbon protein